MIYVTQGHEKGVGLEIFLKSFICLPKKYSENFTLICNRNTLSENLFLAKLTHNFHDFHLEVNGRKLNLIFFSEDTFQTSHSLKLALEKINKADVLLTLPSSKDQIINFNTNTPYHGHTDYFREYFRNSTITMNFLSPKLNVLLLSDHIELSQIYSELNIKNIVEKLHTTLQNLKGLRTIKNIYFAGVNPHCGENGIISKFDDTLLPILDIIKKDYTDINIHGFIPSDTIMFNLFCETDLVVFAYHDQGLIPFKQKNGLIGINLTLGLPFLRMSVDHGTAFNLFGKNKANYQGMLYLLNEIIKNPTFVG